MGVVGRSGRRAARRVAIALTAFGAVSIVHPPPALAQASPARGDVSADTSLVTYGEADYGWRIRALDGDESTLAPFRGEVLFINVWASWCTPCVRELGSIERLRARLEGSGVRFLIVAAEGERPVRRFLRRHGYDLPFFTEVSRMPVSFGLRGIPTSWVVDRDGRIVLVRHGEAVWDTDEVVAFVRGLAHPPD